MNSKVILVIVGIILTIIVGAGVVLFKDRVGDVRPAFFPSPTLNRQNSATDSTNTSTSGEAVNFLKATDGYRITFFSKNAPSARDLEFSPAGTMLVSETGQGKVVAMPDGNHDGVADDEKPVLSSLRNPHGLAFKREGDKIYLFVAEENRVARYMWDEQTLSAIFDRELFDLPGGGGHFTRSLLITQDEKLLVSVGSSCNVCVEQQPFRAAVVISDIEGNDPKVFAKGLRNAVFMTLNTKSKEVWATDMGRDLLGDNVPPEEINIIKDDRDYGWPYCYADRVHDDSFDPRKTRSCEATEAPVYKFQAHSAPLGLTFIDSPLFPPDWQGDLLVAYHGSWNRSVPTGYKVVRMDVEGNTIRSDEDFVSGFLSGSTALGRPVDLIIKDERLYVSDDKAGVIYVVSKG